MHETWVHPHREGVLTNLFPWPRILFWTHGLYTASKLDYWFVHIAGGEPSCWYQFFSPLFWDRSCYLAQTTLELLGSSSPTVSASSWDYRSMPLMLGYRRTTFILPLIPFFPFVVHLGHLKYFNKTPKLPIKTKQAKSHGLQEKEKEKEKNNNTMKHAICTSKSITSQFISKSGIGKVWSEVKPCPVCIFLYI